MTDKSHQRIRLECPQCGEPLRRIARLDYHRLVHPASIRYRCREPRCGWEGLFDRNPSTPLAFKANVSRLAARWSGALAATAAASAGAAVAVVATLAMVGPGTERPDRPRVAQARTIPLGESFDGDALPQAHPLLQLVHASAAANSPVLSIAASGAAQAPGASAGASGPQSNLATSFDPGTGLSIRQRCTWGRPGRSPYKGTVEQALTTARLPPAVVKRIAEKVAARDVSDRLTISNTMIRGQRGQVEFNPSNIAMTYGHTLCLQTRVNFVEGHEEQADLYEVTDAHGMRVSVMVPDVCGNVSVLSERGTVPQGRLLAASDVENPVVKHLFVDYSGPGGGVQNVGLRDNSVPEPNTLLSVLGGLCALAWWSRRRRH